MFNLWKKNNDFEVLFKRACKNQEVREAFHERMLTETLYVLTAPKLREATEVFITGANDRLQVLCLDGNKFPVFTSEDRIFDNKGIENQVSYAAISGQVIFKLFQDNTIVLNPYSKYKKEFSSGEIKNILSRYSTAVQSPLYLQ